MSLILGLAYREYMKKAMASVWIRGLRLDKLAGFWLLLWPTYGALFFPSHPLPEWSVCALFFVGTWATRTAGCLINDWLDRDIDIQVKRTATRPLALGQWNGGYFIGWLGGCLFVAGLVAILLGSQIFQLVPFSLVLIVVYPLTKRWFALPQLVLALTFSQGVLYAFMVSEGALNWHAWVFYLAVAFWIFAFDSVYALNDIEDDQRLMLQSSVISMGRYARAVITFSYAVFILSMMLLYQLYMSFFHLFFLDGLLIVWFFVVVRDLWSGQYWRGFVNNAWWAGLFWLSATWLSHFSY